MLVLLSIHICFILEVGTNSLVARWFQVEGVSTRPMKRKQVITDAQDIVRVPRADWFA